MHKSLTSYKRGLAATLLLLFVAYYIDVNCFVHSHVVNGVTIVHSHAHRNSHHASNDGGHSTWQINLIATINSQFLFTNTNGNTNISPIDYVIETIHHVQECLAPQVHSIHFGRRAPPSA